MGIGQVQGQCGCQGSKGAAGAAPAGQLQELMKNLSSEDRVELQSAMQELTQDERKDIMKEFSKLDTSSLSNDNIFDSLMSLITNKNEESNSSTGIEIYA